MRTRLLSLGAAMVAMMAFVHSAAAFSVSGRFGQSRYAELLLPAQGPTAAQRLEDGGKECGALGRYG